MSHLLLRVAVASLSHGANAARQQQNAQMRQMQAQFHYQQQQLSQQAMLADVLFQTERRARQFHAVAGRDRMVAAVFSAQWLSSVANVTPEHFPNIDHKRAWVAATSHLRTLAPVERDAALGQTIAQFTGCTAELQTIGDALGGQDQAAVAATIGDLQVKADADEKRARTLKIATIIGFASAVALPILLITIGVILQANGVFDKDVNPFGCIGMLAFFVAIPVGIFCGMSFSSKSGSAGRHRREIARLADAMGRLQRFLADPNGGPFLERMHQEHPAFSLPLPDVDGQIVAAPAGVVERQTVVVRCKYCQALTPVDARNCQACGAAKFA